MDDTMTTAAPAASESAPAPVETVSHETAAPVERASEAPESGERTAKTPTRREAIEKAFAAVERGDQPDKPAADVKPTGERARNPDGTFAPTAAEKAAQTPADANQQQTQAKPLDTPPARFSPDAKAAWATAPEAVRGEINRAIAELEHGLTQKSEQLKAFAPLEPYAQRAAQQGTDLKAVIDNYLGWESRLAQDPQNGFLSLMQNMGQDPLVFAQQILERAGVMPGDPSGQSQIYQHQLQQQTGELNGLRQQVSQMQQFIEQMQIEQANNQIAAIAKDKPGFDNLRPVMGQLIQTGMAANLEEAYTMAARLKPDAIQVAPQPAPVMGQPASAQVAQQTTPAAQTRKANLSVTGAPSSGSNPVNRKPPSSAREALQRAFASTGLA